jgi:hypothetical protein
MTEHVYGATRFLWRPTGPDPEVVGHGGGVCRRAPAAQTVARSSRASRPRSAVVSGASSTAASMAASSAPPTRRAGRARPSSPGDIRAGQALCDQVELDEPCQCVPHPGPDERRGTSSSFSGRFGLAGRGRGRVKWLGFAPR